jgi:hypothetical protein
VAAGRRLSRDDVGDGAVANDDEGPGIHHDDVVVRVVDDVAGLDDPGWDDRAGRPNVTDTARDTSRGPGRSGASGSRRLRPFGHGGVVAMTP